MSDNLREFLALMDLVAKGDQTAASQLFHLYNNKVLQLIRVHLRPFPLLRAVYDADDFGQMIWRDLLADPTKCQRFATPVDFLKYLTGMSRNQVRKAARKYLTTQKRDLRRRRHLSDPHVHSSAHFVADPTPTPSQKATSDEKWNRWFQSLTSDQQRFVRLGRAGFSHEYIAAQFCRSLRTIERMADEIRHCQLTDL